MQRNPTLSPGIVGLRCANPTYGVVAYLRDCSVKRPIRCDAIMPIGSTKMGDSVGTVSVRLTPEIEARLDALMAKRRTTRSRYLRAIIEAHLAGNEAESGTVALARAGRLVGSLDGLPADLASNPRHLKGYGR